MANLRKDSKGRGLHTGEQQRKDGVYLYRYTDVTGKRQTVYAGNLPELRAKEKQIKKDIDDNILTDASAKKVTLNEMFNRYMSTKNIRNSTRCTYINLWKTSIKDDIGLIKVVQLKSSHIKTFYMQKSQQGYAHKTIKMMHSLIYASLELAMDDDIIIKNPARNSFSVDFGTETKKKNILSPEQQKELFQFMGKSKVYNIYIPMFTLFLELGLRCGELIGLTWNDVSFSCKTISINHQLIYRNLGDGCKFYISSPKTECGKRILPLTEKALEMLEKQKKINMMLGRCSKSVIDGYSDFIFTTSTGEPYVPASLNKALYGLINAYNKKETLLAQTEKREPNLFPHISLHSFRHTCCTNKARQGMNIKVLQYVMGHSDSSITLDVYNHLDNVNDVREEIVRCEQKAM